MKRTFAVVAALALLCLGIVAQADVLNMGAGSKSLELAAVGNATNAADVNGKGSVGYDYSIGKYEVTANQYAEFLNAVAATDTFNLYNPTMAYYYGYECGIVRSGDSGSYTYSVDAGHANRPVNYVNFWDAARFTNWLANGQLTGAQDATTTESGIYELGGVAVPDNASVVRGAGAGWMIPNQDEWYKAAYYNAATGTYYMYPTSSNAEPGYDMSEATNAGNNANYWGTGATVWPIDGAYTLTRAGEFQLSDSPYGTFDQGGNVAEWNEYMYSSARGRWGGFFARDASEMRAINNPYQGEDASYENYDHGFRVGYITPVPEPSSLLALIAGGIGLFGSVARRRK